MKVKLIQATQNPIDVMWTAARTCYSAKSPIEIWEDRYGTASDDCEYTQEWIEQRTEKHWNLVKKVLDSGHQSIAEHVYFTFAIEGISRACSHQLVRHRAGIVFSQQSQRYVEIKEDYHYLSDLRFDLCGPDDEDERTSEQIEKDCEEITNKIIEVLSPYFVDVNEKNCLQYLDDLIEYTENVHPVLGGMKAEDARMGLPNATKTNITMSVNFRELIHMCNLRLCTRAQKEIRDLHKLMKDEVKKVDERLASYLVPQCEVHNICFEDKCCGRKPNIDEILQDQKTIEELKQRVQDLRDTIKQNAFERE